MPSEEHNKRLQKVIDSLVREGFRVIRIDRRAIPDAIAMKDNEVTAVEVEMGSVKGIEMSSYGNYDHALVIAKSYKPGYHTRTEYERALQLRREGLTYDQIVEKLEAEFNRPFSRNIVHCWAKGKSKPLDAN